MANSASLTATAFAALLKTIYPDDKVEQLAIKDRALLDWLPKVDEYYGEAVVVPVVYEDVQSVSGSLANAITFTDATKQVKFVTSTRKKAYGVVTLDAEAIMASSKDVGAFIQAKGLQINSMLRQLGKNLSIGLYRNAQGQIGTIASATGNVITLTRKSDVHHFGVGMEIVADNDSAGASPTSSAEVTKRNVAAGTITVQPLAVSGTWSTAAGSGYFLFAVGNPSAQVAGLASWLPLTAPGSASFFTVNRTTDITRLSGQRLDNSGRSIMENLQELAMLIGEEGGHPDAVFMNPRAGMVLAEQLGTKVERVAGGKAVDGFTGFTIVNFITGPINIIFDIDCPSDRAYMLQKNTWKLCTMGKVPHLVRDDGQDAIRGATTDTIQVRARYFLELMCRAPGYNGVMSVSVTD